MGERERTTGTPGHSEGSAHFSEDEKEALRILVDGRGMSSDPGEEPLSNLSDPRISIEGG